MSSLNATDTTDTLIATVDLGIFGPGCRVGVAARDGEIVDGVFVEKLELGDTSDMDSDDLEGAAIDAGQLVLGRQGLPTHEQVGRPGRILHSPRHPDNHPRDGASWLPAPVDWDYHLPVACDDRWAREVHHHRPQASDDGVRRRRDRSVDHAPSPKPWMSSAPWSRRWRRGTEAGLDRA